MLVSDDSASTLQKGSGWTHFDVGFGHWANRAKETFEFLFRDVVVQVLDGQLSSGLDLVGFGLVLRKNMGALDEPLRGPRRWPASSWYRSCFHEPAPSAAEDLGGTLLHVCQCAWELRRVNWCQQVEMVIDESAEGRDQDERHTL